MSYSKIYSKENPAPFGDNPGDLPVDVVVCHGNEVIFEPEGMPI